jgi:hypothetical protein
MNPPPRPNPAYATATHEARLDVHIDVVEGTRLIHVEVIHTPEQQRQIQMEHVEHLRRLIAEMQREIDNALEWDCSVERRSKQVIGINNADPRFADEENYPTVHVYDPAAYAGGFSWINKPNTP